MPRGRILCLAETEADAVIQLAAVLAMGCQVLWPNNAIQQHLPAELPALVNQMIRLTDNWQLTDCQFDGVIFHGDRHQLQTICQAVAECDVPIISVQGYRSGDQQLFLERLVHERAVSINTAAVGGNASLMTLE